MTMLSRTKQIWGCCQSTCLCHSQAGFPMWTTNSGMLGSSPAHAFPRVGMRKQNRTHYQTVRFISKDRFIGQYGNFTAPCLCVPFVVHICPLSRGNTSKSLSLLESRTLSPKKDTVLSESRDREKWNIAGDTHWQSLCNVCQMEWPQQHLLPTPPTLCSVLFMSRLTLGNEFYTQVLYFNEEGQHGVRVKTWLWGQTDLSLNPSRATGKPDDLGTLKNFLSFSVIFYNTRLILSTIQDWWEIKYIMEP